MKIENLNINGGQQQFAEIIINSSEIFDETDKGLIQLFHDNIQSSERRAEMLRSLKVVKSTEQPEEERKKSGTLIKKFLDSAVSEGGKQLVKEIAENGLDWTKYIFG